MKSEVKARETEGVGPQRPCPESWSPWTKANPRKWPFWVQAGAPFLRHAFLGHDHCGSLSGSGEPQGRARMGGMLRLRGQPDLGSSLTLPPPRYVTLGKSVSLSPRFPHLKMQFNNITSSSLHVLNGLQKV